MNAKEQLPKMKKMLMVVPALVLLSGCASVKIRQVLNNPARYQGRDVRLNGEVTRSTGLIVTGLYEIDDGTGKLSVLSNHTIPRKGSNVTVTGRMQAGVSVLGQTVGTLLREDSVKIHN